MKAYVPNEKNEFVYAEDMNKILSYLTKNGTINVKESTVERLYEMFSNDIYCASWMGARDEIIEEFAEWLSEYNI